MNLFFIFVVLASIGVIARLMQNLAVRASILKNSIVPEADILTDTSKQTPRSGATSASGKPSPNGFYPPLSILKPLKGLDEDLFGNLISFCNQDYPNYEIIFALEEATDPALTVAHKIKKIYPHKKISIVIKKKDYALNPKVNNLIAAYEASQFPYILISDSDVRVDHNYLREITRPLKDPRVGVVSNLIRGVGSRTLGSLLENLHLNSFVIGNVALLTWLFKMPVIVGKSLVRSKVALEAIGGFAAVKDVLAEDYIIGLLMRDKGKDVITSSYVVNAVNKHRTMSQFCQRHSRWGKMRWKMVGIRYISELISNAVFMACLSLVLVGPSARTIALVAAASLLTVMGDYWLGRQIRSAHHLGHYLLTPLKDIFIGYMWFVPFFNQRVKWRRHTYKITKGSYLVPLPDEKI